jgi:hypothetical protein
MSEAHVSAGPGPKAKRGGTKVKNGQAIQVTSYPRERTKAQLVKYAALAGLSLSSFLIVAGLDKAATMQNESTGKTLTGKDLVPEDEYAELLRKRGGKTKG